MSFTSITLSVRIETKYTFYDSIAISYCKRKEKLQEKKLDPWLFKDGSRLSGLRM